MSRVRYVRTMQGLGDAFAARPTIAALLEQDGVLLETAWPEVFDFGLSGKALGLRFARPAPQDLRIACARRNVANSKTVWWDPPADAGPALQLGYVLQPGCASIPEQIAESAGVLDGIEWCDFFMPNANGGEMNCDMGHRYCLSPLGVFRIPTIRTEYRNSARNPAPGLVAAAVEEIGGRDWISLNDLTHYEVVSEDEKWPRVGAVKADFGELSLPSMLDIVARARCVVTPVSWMLWAAAAYQVPTLAIWGGYCGPETILGTIWKMSDHCRVNGTHGDPDNSGMCIYCHETEDSLCDSLKIVEPEKVCRCFNPSHACDKSIPVERVREAARCVAR